MASIVCIEEVVKGYVRGKQRVEALRGLDLKGRLADLSPAAP